jgi:arylamine N-acetyltransferase
MTDAALAPNPATPCRHRRRATKALAGSSSSARSRHLTRVPFENISKLYKQQHHGLTGLPSIELYLDGIERYHFGGTCYSNNFHFYSLLAALGYDVKLCAADTKTPDVQP